MSLSLPPSLHLLHFKNRYKSKNISIRHTGQRCFWCAWKEIIVPCRMCLRCCYGVSKESFRKLLEKCVQLISHLAHIVCIFIIHLNLIHWSAFLLVWEILTSSKVMWKRCEWPCVVQTKHIFSSNSNSNTNGHYHLKWRLGCAAAAAAVALFSLILWDTIVNILYCPLGNRYTQTIEKVVWPREKCWNCNSPVLSEFPEWISSNDSHIQIHTI